MIGHKAVSINSCFLVEIITHFIKKILKISARKEYRGFVYPAIVKMIGISFENGFISGWHVIKFTRFSKKQKVKTFSSGSLPVFTSGFLPVFTSGFLV